MLDKALFLTKLCWPSASIFTIIGISLVKIKFLLNYRPSKTSIYTPFFLSPFKLASPSSVFLFSSPLRTILHLVFCVNQVQYCSRERKDKMPAMVMSNAGPSGAKKFEGRITIYVVICGIIAATGGLMFGYDIGISGKFHFVLIQ